MPDLPLLLENEAFDESGYLRLYPDVGGAVANGLIESGWHHYHRHGRAEGRRPNDVDAGFYVSAYPQIEADLGREALPADAASHFVRYGRARGYLPNIRAPRGPDSMALSPRAGLWTDQPDALDRITSRLATGRINHAQATLLRSWTARGFVVLDNALPRTLRQSALRDLERVFAGACDDALFDTTGDGTAPRHWRPELVPDPAACLDIHYLSQAARTALFSPTIQTFLEALLDAKPLLFASRGFLRDLVMPRQQDCALAACTLPRQLVSAWIALEDPAGDVGGQLHVWSGSHRLPDYLYNRKYKSVAEAERMGDPSARRHLLSHTAVLDRHLGEYGFSRTVLALPAGSALIRHADLVHGGVPAAPLRTVRGFVGHYCPLHAAPLYAEHLPTRHFRQDGDAYTSGIYADLEPLD